LLLATLAAGGCASATVVRVADAVPTNSTTRLASNRQAAVREAAQLLASLRLPAGATGLSREPRADDGWLRPSPSILTSLARSDTHAWWSVPGAPLSVLHYVEAHPPPGASRFGTGSGGVRNRITEWDVTYQWPDVPGVLTARLLLVVVTALPGHRTGMLAEAQADWFVPRPASERVPAGVGTIELGAGAIGKPPTLTRTITSTAQIRQIVSLIDGMQVAQPAVVNCPAEVAAGAVVITLKFDGTGSRPLAQARYFDYPPLSEPSEECRAVAFWVHGRQQTPLIGGRFVQRLEAITGARLTN
jgi:hypothetical protein